MIISCVPGTEAKLRQVVDLLKAAGMFDQYAEQAHGETIVLSVHPRNFEERERLKEILDGVGITDLMYDNEDAA